jgi:hypothetical protein
MTMLGLTVYRAIDPYEAADIKASGLFRPGQGSYETGKLFFREYDDMVKFAERENEIEGNFTNGAKAEIPPGTPTQDIDLPGEGPAIFVPTEGLPAVEPVEVFPIP